MKLISGAIAPLEQTLPSGLIAQLSQTLPSGAIAHFEKMLRPLLTAHFEKMLRPGLIAPLEQTLPSGLIAQLSQKLHSGAIAHFEKAVLPRLTAWFKQIKTEVIPILENQPDWLMLVIANKSFPESERLRALERLESHKTFSRRSLFHPTRWEVLEKSFAAYCAEQGLTKEQAWTQLIRPALVLGISEAMRQADAKDDTSVVEFFRMARCAVRREVEKAILDGFTLDRKQEIPLPEDFDLIDDWTEPESGEISEHEAKVIRFLAETLTTREFQALAYRPTDKAGLMTRKRAMDKIRNHQSELIALLVNAAGPKD